MKKVTVWIMVFSVLTFLISWGVAGVKIMNGDYDFAIEAYIALGAMLIYFGCSICRAVGNRCPHCGKIQWIQGNYCANCGHVIEKV